MNFKQAVAILKAVKKARADGKYASSFVCDTIGNVVTDGDFGDGDFGDGAHDTASAIKEDISKIIKGSFGVPEYLGVDTPDYPHGADNKHVVNFRKQMVNMLIAKYSMEAIHEAV